MSDLLAVVGEWLAGEGTEATNGGALGEQPDESETAAGGEGGDTGSRDGTAAEGGQADEPEGGPAVGAGVGRVAYHFHPARDTVKSRPGEAWHELGKKSRTEGTTGRREPPGRESLPTTCLLFPFRS